MKGILINPITKSVSDWVWDGNRESIVKALNCTYFTIVRLTANADLFVDDEGYFVVDNGSFVIQTYPSPLKGNGIVLGRDNHGNTIDSPLVIETVRNMVSFEGERVYQKKAELSPPIITLDIY